MAWALANWKLLVGGAMLVTIGVLMFIIGGKNDKIEALRNDVATCEARHSITRQSLATAERAIAEQNEAVQRLEAEGQERSEAATEALRRAQEANREARGAIERLKRSAAQRPAEGNCGVSETLRETEGL